MLAASSGMDMRGVLRTLRPVGRDTSRDSGTRIRLLVGSTVSSAGTWMARASLWGMAFMVIAPCGEECSSERSGKGCCLPLPRGDSDFQLAQAIGQHPEGAVQAHIGVNALHRAGFLAATI